MRLAVSLIGAVALIVVAAPAFAAEKPAAAGKCFLMKDVGNHTVGGDHTLYFAVAGRSVYRVEMSNNCLGGASSTDPITIKERSGSNICGPLDLDISATVNGGGLASRCVIDTITRLTAAQAAALPAKLKP
jgi:hypothetical protein